MKSLLEVQNSGYSKHIVKFDSFPWQPGALWTLGVEEVEVFGTQADQVIVAPLASPTSIDLYQCSFSRTSSSCL